MKGTPSPTLADIRQAVREEFKAILAASSPPAEPVDTEADELLRAERAQQVQEESQMLIQRALSRGTWENADRDALRGLLDEMPIPEQDALIGSIFAAIQSGRLKVEGGGPPL